MEGRLTEIHLLGLLAQKVLTFYRSVCSFPLYMARQNCSDPFCSHGSSSAEGTCLWPWRGWSYCHFPRLPARCWHVAGGKASSTGTRKTAANTWGKAGVSSPEAAYLYFQLKWPWSHFPAGHTYSPCSISELPVDSINLGTVCRATSRQPNP